jgi:uncharacterized protein involved in propanediol utilization
MSTRQVVQASCLSQSPKMLASWLTVLLVLSMRLSPKYFLEYLLDTEEESNGVPFS